MQATRVYRNGGPIALPGVLLAMMLCATSGCQPPAKSEAAPAKPPEVSIAQVVERATIDQEDFTGRFDAIESVEVRSRVRGYLNTIHFTDGQEVKAGTLLFEIDPRTFEAQVKAAEGQKAQWIAKREKAKADVERYENLVPTGAASAQDLDKVRAEFGEAIAAIQTADADIDRAKLDLEFSKITAPINGQVGRALITKGNLVQSGAGDDALLTTIVSIDPVYVYFGVNERTLLRFRERHRGAAQASAADLKIPVVIGLANETGFPHQGVIDFADNRVDPSTGTIRVRATVDNAKRIFKPGLFARVRVPISDSYSALLVSQLAVGTDQGQKYVLVVNEKGDAERRFVKLGPPQDDGLQVVSDGLRAGEWVVVNGLQRVRPGKPVTPQRVDMPSTRIGAPQSAPAASTKKSSD